MTSPLSAFDEIRQLKVALNTCQFARDEARQERDAARVALAESLAERDRLRRGLFAAGRELDEITAQRNEARAAVSELITLWQPSGYQADQAALILVGLPPAVDEFLARPETGAVRQRPEPS